MIYLMLSAGFKDNNPDQFEKRLKIGYASDIDARLKTYKTHNPDCILLKSIEGTVEVEYYLHKKFKEYKYPNHPEWFYYSQNIIDYFNSTNNDSIVESKLLLEAKNILRNCLSSVEDLKNKYLNDLLEEIRSREDFDEGLYNEDLIRDQIMSVWKECNDIYNSAIDNAVISKINKSNIDCLAVDITLDLPQILGRQRLLSNPWKNRAELYFKTSLKSETPESFVKRVQEKREKTESLLSIYGKGNEIEKHNLAGVYQDRAKSRNYKDDYVAVNTRGGKDLFPVFNNLVMVSEFRAYEIHQIDYKDRFTVFNALREEGNNFSDEVENFLRQFESFGQFTDKMKFLCESGFSGRDLDDILNCIPMVFKNYYITLGPEKIRNLQFKNSMISAEYERLKANQQNSKSLEDQIYSTFIVGEKYLKSDIKTKLRNIYSACSIKSSPKAVDLLKYFEAERCRISVDGKQYEGFKLINRI